MPAAYVILTSNNRRKQDQIDAANPRADNRFGHIIEMIPPDGDHTADKFRWEILVRCGDPAIAAVGATFSSETSRNGCPLSPLSISSAWCCTIRRSRS